MKPIVIRSFFKKHPFYVFLLGNLAYLLLLWVLCPPRAESNDDFYINAIANGIVGSPTANVVYPNVLVGWLLRGASALVPGINWFWILLFTTTLLAYSWAGVALQRRLKGWGMVFYGPFVTVTGYGFYVLWTYTRTASLATAAGWLCWMDAMGEPQKRKKQLVAGGALILLGLLIRRDSFLMVTGLAAAMFCGRLLSDVLEHRKLSPTSWRAPLLLMVTICAAFAADSAAYSGTEWSNFRAYDKARQQLFDYKMPDYARNAQEMEALGLSEQDYALASEWTYADSEKLNTDTLNAVLAMRSEEVELTGWTLQTALMRFVQQDYLLLCLLFTVLLLCMAKRFHWLPVLGLYSGIWLELTILVYHGRYPDRVMAGLGAAAVLLLVGIHSASELPVPSDGSTDRKAPLRKFSALLGIVVAVPLLLDGERWLSPETYRYKAATAAEQQASIAEVEAGTDSSFLYLEDAGAQFFFWEMYPLWRSPLPGSEMNYYALGGWHIDMPVTNAVLSSYGVQNPMEALGANDKVLLVDLSADSVQEKIEYVRRNYHPDITWSVYNTVQGRLLVAVTDCPVSIGSESRNVQLQFSAQREEEYLTLMGHLDGVVNPEVSEANQVWCLLVKDESNKVKAFRFPLLQEGMEKTFTVRIPLSELEGESFTVSAAYRQADTAEFSYHTTVQPLELSAMGA